MTRHSDDELWQLELDIFVERGSSFDEQMSLLLLDLDVTEKQLYGGRIPRFSFRGSLEQVWEVAVRHLRGDEDAAQDMIDYIAYRV